MKYVNDFGVAPTRGTEVAAGIDFYMPDPATWEDKQKQLFYAYLEDKKLSEVLQKIKEYYARYDVVYNETKVLEATLMYVSFDSAVKIPINDWMEHRYENRELTVFPGESICVPSGIRTMFAHEWFGVFLNKSGIGRTGWVVKAQVIDEDYTGYVHINMVNTNTIPLKIKLGQKLSQLIELPTRYMQPEELDSETYFKAMESSKRGEGAFSSTGLF